MNQQEQKWLVLLYSLIELDGEGTKQQVLQHIMNHHYWHKNDQNDEMLTTRPETKWRNDFSFERQHLVERGYMGKGTRGKWSLTENGRDFFYSLVEKANENVSSEATGFTASFLQKLYHAEMYSEEAADRVLLNRISDYENDPLISTVTWVDGPIPKGAVSRRAGHKNIYRRDPSVSVRALNKAGHLCEIDVAHPSFLRKNSSRLYMEPHHLIPMSMTDLFGVSLDREQNIFSLCSNCHNQVHYGTKEDVRRILSLLFHSRTEGICSILGRSITIQEIYQIYDVL
ncbi:hypothetical protein C8Z91_22205 [Paenibacillus elgii]|uniref:Restriction system protein Mrr-like N-terminal domain-containing protein n=1 Tax=Paenibacillus elgii TaxID=189691 RepID=A0A2T6FYV1_9BACL|nr:winged helix-turn-helix domain-containing protein [Paenibacillus elgii]PUA37060.1 hypothetical protein C8Z91_22205 [Paenibacillus elgii]